MPIQDRTNEFRACVESIRSRSVVPTRATEQRQRLLQQRGKENAKSEFNRMASAIGKDISATTLKLGKLAQRESTPFSRLEWPPLEELLSMFLYLTVAKRKTLFDDRPVEISVRVNFSSPSFIFPDSVSSSFC